MREELGGPARISVFEKCAKFLLILRFFLTASFQIVPGAQTNNKQELKHVILAHLRNVSRALKGFSYFYTSILAILLKMPKNYKVRCQPNSTHLISQNILLSFIVRLQHDILSVTGNKPQLCVQFQQYLQMMPEETTC